MKSFSADSLTLLKNLSLHRLLRLEKSGRRQPSSAPRSLNGLPDRAVFEIRRYLQFHNSEYQHTIAPMKLVEFTYEEKEAERMWLTIWTKPT
jgi:hypothetical protein